MAYEEVQKYKKNDVIFTEVESEKSMFLIKRGTVLLYRQTEHNPIPVVTLKPGDWFGVPGFFLEVNRNICAKAMSDSTIIKVQNTGDLAKDVEGLPDWIKSSVNSSLKTLKATYDKILAFGDNIVTIDYGAIKNKYLSQEQIYELLRALSLVELILYRYSVEDNGVQLIDNEKIKEIIKKFFPKLSIGTYRFEKFLAVLGVIINPEKEDIADYLQVGEMYKLKAVINFIEYALQKNVYLLQLPNQDVEIISAIIEIAEESGKIIKRPMVRVKKDNQDEQASKGKDSKDSDEASESGDHSMMTSDPLLQEILEEELNEGAPIEYENKEVPKKSKIDLSVEKDLGIESKIRPDNRFVGQKGVSPIPTNLVSITERSVYDHMLKKTEYRGTINHTKKMAQNKIFERVVNPKDGTANIICELSNLKDCMPFFRIFNELIELHE